MRAGLSTSSGNGIATAITLSLHKYPVRGCCIRGFSDSVGGSQPQHLPLLLGWDDFPAGGTGVGGVKIGRRASALRRTSSSSYPRPKYQQEISFPSDECNSRDYIDVVGYVIGTDGVNRYVISEQYRVRDGDATSSAALSCTCRAWRYAGAASGVMGWVGNSYSGFSAGVNFAVGWWCSWMGRIVRLGVTLELKVEDSRSARET